MGALRGAGGKFAHILRFKTASALQSVSGIGGALSAIAMQAQLASIEAAIGEVGNKVDALQATVDRVRESDGLATREVILEVYRAIQSTGALTRAMWEQIAPLNQPVRRLRKYAELEAEALTRKLEDLRRRPDQGAPFLLQRRGRTRPATGFRQPTSGESSPGPVPGAPALASHRGR